METVKLDTIIKKDGEINIKGVPFYKGDKIKMIISSESEEDKTNNELSADKILKSGIVGIWEDRDDIIDSSSHARELRNKAQIRNFNKW